MVINQFRNHEVVISSYVSEDDLRGDSALIDEKFANMAVYFRRALSTSTNQLRKPSFAA